MQLENPSFQASRKCGILGKHILVIVFFVACLSYMLGLASGRRPQTVVKINAVERDGSVFLHFPILRAIDVRAETRDGHPADLPEGVICDASLEPGQGGKPNTIQVNCPGYEEVLDISSITLRY